MLGIAGIMRKVGAPLKAFFVRCEGVRAPFVFYQRRIPQYDVTLCGPQYTPTLPGQDDPGVGESYTYTRGECVHEEGLALY